VRAKQVRRQEETKLYSESDMSDKVTVTHCGRDLYCHRNHAEIIKSYLYEMCLVKPQSSCK
jgi:hypothetical protein